VDASGVIAVGEAYHLMADPVADKLEIVVGEHKVCVEAPVGGGVLFMFTRTSKRVRDSQALSV